jgi:non-ribosomal peptide synthetase component F
MDRTEHREKVENLAIHRLVEQQSAARGDAPAIVDGTGIVAYRDLNHRANAIARHLINQGFRRGSHASVSLPRGADLAAVLLAILKAGGSYSWRAARSPLPQTVIRVAPNPACESPASSLDLAHILRVPVQAGPNLPVLVRASDIACVLGDDPASGVLVPHATIAAIPVRAADQPWAEESGAFDLWAGLMAGATLTVESTPATAFEAAA